MYFRQTDIRRRWNGLRHTSLSFALPLAMIITLLVLVLGLALMEITRIEAVKAERDVQRVKALAAAEMGLQRAKAMAKSQNCSWSVMKYNG